MEEGLLSLKWNNHKSTFFQVLSGLREKHTYTDVTLACDGQVYPAHKFVLSTCSEYFSEIFTSTTGTSIVIVLKDVRRQDLEYLMDYMYLGQVDVAQSELPSLIKTAECLRIKGLAIPDDEPHKTQRRGADEREGSPPPSKKKRYLQEDDRHPASSTSTTNNNNTTTSTSSSSSSTSASGRIQMEVLPPPSDLSSLVQHLRQPSHPQQPLQAPPPPPPTSQGSSKSHSSQSLSLNLTTQASRTSQGGSSGPHVHTPTSTPAPSSHRHHSSPSHTTPVPVIKEEAADPPETPEGYLNESFEENETKPDVSDARHLDPDGAVPGPSGLQGSDNWDGDGEMGGYGAGDGYPEGSLEEHGESEVQGRADASRGMWQKRSSSGGKETLGARPVPNMQPSQSQHSPEAFHEITEPLCVSLNPQHRPRWCSSAGFSMVKEGKIMNIIPVYKTSWNKIIHGTNQKPQPQKKIQESIQGTNAPSGFQGKEKHEEGKRHPYKGHKGHQGRQEQEPQNPMMFGRLSYTPCGLEMNVTSSVPNTREEPIRNASIPLLSSSSSSSSSSAIVSDSEESSTFDVDYAPEVIETTDTQPHSLPIPHGLPTSYMSPLPSQRPSLASSPQLSSSSTITASPSRSTITILPSPPTSSLSPSVDSRMSSPVTPLPPSSPSIEVIKMLSGPHSTRTITISNLPQLHPLSSLQSSTPRIRTLPSILQRAKPHKMPSPLLQVPQLCSPTRRERKTHHLSAKDSKKIPVHYIASNITVSTKGASKAKTAIASQVKSCSVRMPRVLACHHCSLVLPDAKKLKKHIYSCRNSSRIDVKSIPDHNYY